MAVETAPPSEAQVIMDTLRRIVQSLRQASTSYSGGLTSAQVFVLRTLQAHDGASVNDLANLTHTHQSTVSEVVSRLETKGFIERHVASADRRRVELHLSPAGREIVSRQAQTPQEDIVGAIAALSVENRAALAQGLLALAQAAGLAETPPPLFFEGTDDA